jgi:ketosteroid isomerase-like protein
MTMTMREAFERGTEAFNAHDLDGFAAVLADDVVYETPGGIGGQGKQGCVESYGAWLSAFSDAHVEVHHAYFIDDVAVEEGTFSGTHDGVLHAPTGDVPPTGRKVSLDYVHVIRFREGKHAYFKLIFDRLQMLEQLGLIPAATSDPHPPVI